MLSGKTEIKSIQNKISISNVECITPSSRDSKAFLQMTNLTNSEFKYRHLCVTDNGDQKGKFLGLLSRRDFFRNFNMESGRQELSEKKTVNDIMTPINKLKCMTPNNTFKELLDTFSNPITVDTNRFYISLLPLIDNNFKLLGVISYIDVLKFLAKEESLKKYLDEPISKYPNFEENGKDIKYFMPEYEELDEMITKFILGYPRTVPILFVEKNTDIINNSFYGITTDWLILLATKKTDGEKQKILISKSNDNLSEDQMFFNNILYISKEHLSSHILYKDSSLKDVINGLQVNPKIEALPVLKDKDSDSFYGIYSYVDLFRDISSFLDSNDQKDDISNSEDSLEK